MMELRVTLHSFLEKSRASTNERFYCTKVGFNKGTYAIVQIVQTRKNLLFFHVSYALAVGQSKLALADLG